MLKTKNIVLVSIIVICLLALITNPSSKSDYVDWVSTQIKDEGGVLLGMISSPIVKSTTTKKNYLLFTLYKTGDDSENSPNLVVLGIFDNFFWIRGANELKE